MTATTRVLLWLAGWVFVLLLAAMGLTALAVGHSRKQLEAYRASLEKRGEHFDVAALAPAAPPTEGNRAGELLAVAKDLGEINKAETIRLMQSVEEKSPGVNIVQHLEEHATVSSKAIPWEEMQEKFKPLTPLLATIRELSQSPFLETQLDYSKGFSMPLTGVTESLKAGQYLGQEGLLFLHQGNAPAAVENIQAILRVARITEKQPLLISNLVTASLLGIAQTLTWETLQSSALRPADLDTLQKAWSRISITPSIVPSWRMERANALPFFDAPSYSAISAVSSTSGSPAMSSLPKSLDEFLSISSFAVWSVLYRHADEKQFIETYQTLIDLAPADPLTGPWMPMLEAGRNLQARLADAGIGRLFSRMILPAVETSSGRIISTQATVNLTVTALALQRHHLAQGDYPPSLSDLVPAFLPAVPADPFDGKPLRFHRLNSQGYLLHAIGPDGMDNQGDATKPSKRRSLHDGKDIVWPQAAQ